MNKNEVFPDSQQVRKIFKDTYNFYTEWVAVKEIDWEALMIEVRQIEQTHPFELCRKILVELLSIIEATHMERSEIDGA